MSYEGYERVLCRNGHLDEDDCYDANFTRDEWRCAVCGEPRCWWEQVDQTNDAGTQTHLVVHEQHQCCCAVCGDHHQSKAVQYCIPLEPEPEYPTTQHRNRPAPLVPVVRCGSTVLEAGEHFTTDEADRRYAELADQRWQQHQ
ncbi:hypothetical protein LCGC14_1838720 [marine sediment metagenome]|uniref:Uncharacterized protein n=1 Tax=marine sediment metagenome TaxID=412755 RepID=A0A0F9H214_9ZZZZ